MRGMKKVVSSNDVDSAFGSAESTTKDDSNEKVYLLLIFLNYIFTRTIFCLFKLASDNIRPLYDTFFILISNYLVHSSHA